MSVGMVKFRLVVDYTVRPRRDHLANGSVGDIGESLLRIRDTADVSHDVDAVYNIAATLLGLSQSANTVSTAGLMADQFTKMPAYLSSRELLKVQTLAASLWTY